MKIAHSHPTRFLGKIVSANNCGIKGDVDMKKEVINSELIELINDDKTEIHLIELLNISSKISEIKNLATLLDDEEIKYFSEMINLLVREKLVLYRYNYK